ncbi:MAG: restriction endonuclease subunit S [Oscillospiraceae bacterium]|nr:restriction endonuclease subunit S [Oscillospiraceae bacterium]
MSRLDELIKKLCPDGVEYVKIGKLCDKTKNIQWNNVSETFEYIDLATVDISTHNITSTITITKYDAPSRARQIVKTDDILFATTRPTQMRVCKISSKYDGQICSTGFCVLRPLKDSVIPSYLLHAISTEYFKLYLEKNQSIGNYPAISDSLLKKFQIPLPPLEVQREIVRILDSFTEYIDLLEKELVLRKKQYTYYRDYLLNFGDDVKRRTLGEVCNILTGYPFDSSLFSESGVRLMRGMNIKRGQLDFTETNNRYWNDISGFEKYLLNENDIVIAMDGSLVGKSYGIIKKEELPLILVQRVARLRSDTMNIRYVYFWILSHFTDYVDKKKSPGAIPHISQKDISNFKIPVPSLEEQERIVAILDRFDRLCNDFTCGLPAEIQARQKQYAYYRDKLLNFKKLN